MHNNEEGKSLTLPFVDNAETLSHVVPLNKDQYNTIIQVCLTHSLRIPYFYLGLMEKDNPSCPIRQQAIPTGEELQDAGTIDPLNEGSIAVTPGLMKRHPGRAVFLVSAECAMYCRYCNRKRVVGKGWDPGIFFEESFRYIEGDKGTREIILSGGDPFMLDPAVLNGILARLRSIPHINTIRISSRVPVVHPDGMTDAHFRTLKKHEPLWIVIHINHPKEVTGAFLALVKRFRAAGCIMISQTVLLRNVNDCENILLKLFELLVGAGIKPYYLFQLDEVKGAQHFKVKIEKGIHIMRALREKGSGLAMPQYAVDITGGLGKVPLDYVYLKQKVDNTITIENQSGQQGTYMDDGLESKCHQCGICGK